MKIRTGFVSNSSSSSFICQKCGAEIYVAEDDDVPSCPNGHVICRGHIKENIQEMRTFVMNHEAATQEDLNIASHANDEEFLLYFSDECLLNTDYYKEEVYISEKDCPICQFEIMEDFLLLKYILKKTGINIDDIKASVKEEFKDYKSYVEFVKDFKDED